MMATLVPPRIAHYLEPFRLLPFVRGVRFQQTPGEPYNGRLSLLAERGPSSSWSR